MIYYLKTELRRGLQVLVIPYVCTWRHLKPGGARLGMHVAHCTAATLRVPYAEAAHLQTELEELLTKKG